MQKTNKRYTDYDKNFILAAMKVGAQNGIPQEIIAEQIAPVLCRKPSAIVSQMYALRSEWVKNIQTEMTLAYSKVKCDREEIVTIETEYTEAIDPETADENESEPEPKTEPEAASIETTPVLRPPLEKPKGSPTVTDEPVTPEPTNPPALGDEIEVVVISLRDFGAIVKGAKCDIRGLIHISNISDDYVHNVEDRLHVGQRVNAVAIKREADGRYGFSLRKEAANNNVWHLGVTN